MADVPDLSTTADERKQQQAARFNEGLKQLSLETGWTVSAEAHIVNGLIVAVPILVELTPEKKEDKATKEDAKPKSGPKE